MKRKYILMILVSFLFAVALIYRYSLAIEINDGVAREKAALAALENENSLLRKQLIADTDLEKIKLLAESKLAMQKPDETQIVYIKVPRKDYALAATSARIEDRSLGSLVGYIIDQAKSVQKRLIAD